MILNRKIEPCSRCGYGGELDTALVYDNCTKKAYFHKEGTAYTIEFSDKINELFELFVKNPGKVYIRDYLIEVTHADNLDVSYRIIDTFVCRINKKVKEVTGKKLIHSKRGIGYFSVKIKG